MKILLTHLNWPFFADLDQQQKSITDSCLCAKQHYIKTEKKMERKKKEGSNNKMYDYFLGLHESFTFLSMVLINK